MTVPYKPTGRTMSMPAGVMLGAGWAFLWTIAASIILAKLIDTEVIAESAVGYCSIVILLTASALGSTLAWKKIRRQRALVCAIAGGVYFLELIALTCLLFGGRFQAVAVTAGLIAAGSGTVILSGLGKPQRKKYYPR